MRQAGRVIEDPDRCYLAVQSRDPRFDGWFFTAVLTTRIYCRPSCPARTPLPSRTSVLPHCGRCPAGRFPCLQAVSAECVARIARMGCARRRGRSGDAPHRRRCGRPSRCRRTVRAARLQRAAARADAPRRSGGRTDRDRPSPALPDGAGAHRDHDALDIGHRLRCGLRRASASSTTPYSPSSGCRPPSSDRGSPVLERRGSGPGLDVTLPSPSFPSTALSRQSLRPPRGHCRPRRGGGPRTARYRRTLPARPRAGDRGTRPTPDHVACTLVLSDLRDLTTAIARCRLALDLDADPEAIDERLASDRLLAPLVAKAPGRRVPRCVDGAELAFRAVLGQQVSTAAARTVTERMVQAVRRRGIATAGAASPGCSRPRRPFERSVTS